MGNTEITINKRDLPEKIYHLVPISFFEKYSDIEGNYDCRNKADWGMNSPFIHTTPNTIQLKQFVADPNWSNRPLVEKFVLLEIQTKLLECKITYTIINENIYHHIWGGLLAKLFITKEVARDADGKFLI